MSEPDGTSDWCDALFVSMQRHFISSVSKTHTFNEPPYCRNYHGNTSVRMSMSASIDVEFGMDIDIRRTRRWREGGWMDR
jgi:hypothetical protein